MSKFISFSIIISFLGLWFKTFLNDEAQNYVGFCLIFSFGLLHGANDLLLINKSQTTKKKISSIKILLYYVLVVILGAVLFYFFPGVALALFIGISGYHFGQQHWQFEVKEHKNWFAVLFQLFYGLLILALLFVFHPTDVQRIIGDISGFIISETMLITFFYTALIGALLFAFLIGIATMQQKKPLLVELLLLLVLAILFNTSSLIWGFALYFVIWHSIPSMKDQIHFLYGSFTWSNFIRYFKSAAIYWLVSLVGIGFLYFFFNQYSFFDALFFAFLAAITFPHVWVIVQMFKTKSPEQSF
jgi:Brp/Blh family beta-carotene 15,15'-monooxygenase